MKLSSKWRSVVPVAAVVTLLAIGLALMSVARFRRGASVMGAALVLAAVLRLALPLARLGPLAVRSRTFDVLFYLLLAGLTFYLVLI